MTPPLDPNFVSPTGQRILAAVPVVTILPAGPDWAVIVPTAPVELPAALLDDARKYHAIEMVQRAKARFLVQSFEDWLADIVRDAIYGHGADAGEVADWMGR